MAYWLTTTDPEVSSFFQAGAKIKLRNGWRPSQPSPAEPIGNEPQQPTQPENLHYAINQADPSRARLTKTASCGLPQPQSYPEHPAAAAPAQETTVEPSPVELATDLL